MRYIYIISCLFLWVSNLKSEIQQDTSFCDLKNEISFYIFNRPNHDSAFKLLEKGITLAYHSNDSIALASMYFQKGALYVYTNPDLSLQYFYKAKEIYRKLNDKKGLADTYRVLGISNNLTNKQRLDFLKKAIALSKETEAYYTLANAYNHLGYHYCSLEEYDSALFYFQESVHIRERKKLNTPMNLAEIAGAYNNIGLVYRDLNQYELALKYYYKALRRLPGNVNKDFHINIQANIAAIYLATNNLDSAFYYFDEIKDHFYRRPDVAHLFYGYLSEFYKKREEYQKALVYYQKSDSIKDVIQQKEKVDALKLLELEYDAKVKKEQLTAMSAEISKAKIKQLSLLIGSLLILLFSSLLLFQQKQKARKKRALLKAEQKLLNAELQNSEIKRMYLNDELKYTNKELTSFAAGVAQNYSFLNDLRQQIVSISREKDSEKMREQLRDMNIMLLQIFKDSKKGEEFIEKARKINHSLIFYLKTHFDQLTESDINLLIMTFLKFDTKEISILYNIEPKSVRMKRYRLRKKLDLNTEDSFEEFFNKIIEETTMRHTG